MLDPEIKGSEWQHPVAWQVYDLKREMYRITLEDGSVLLVSPEHRVYAGATQHTVSSGQYHPKNSV